jgi:uncharacterized protein YbbK (DUF523 family)/uncharacterized protein YbgA (DUF1722 family)
MCDVEADSVVRYAERLRPRILLSRCIELASCRWDGQIVREAFVAKLLGYIDAVDVCPEVDIGLGVPRDPVRLVREAGGGIGLVQPATGRALASEMQSFSSGFLRSVGELDGAVLKSRSPSCGIHETKVYPAADSRMATEKASGLFAAAVLERMPAGLVTNEGRLRSFALRERWLTAVFTLARFREMAAECLRDRTAAPLVRFQASHKLLFLSLGGTGMASLGRIAANPERLGLEELLDAYRAVLVEAISGSSSAGRTVDVLQHALGYFKRSVSLEERAHFLELVSGCREGVLPLSACTSVLGSWIVREQQSYLAGQVFFHLYPAGLVEISDSGGGRDL